MQRVKQRVSVLDILNLHMSSNSYKRWNLRLQPHSTKQLPLLHNYNIQNESLSQQAIYTFWCWTSFQKGLRPDRPTQPETWRSSEALQECKKNQQQIVPLQPEVKVGCRRGCAQHVLRLCLRKSWPSCRSSKRTFQRICGNRFWFWFRLHVWYRIEGVNRMSFPPKRPFSEPTQISRKKAFKLSLNHPRTYTCPLPSASHILVPGLKTIFLPLKASLLHIQTFILECLTQGYLAYCSLVSDWHCYSHSFIFIALAGKIIQFWIK